MCIKKRGSLDCKVSQHTSEEIGRTAIHQRRVSESIHFLYALSIFPKSSNFKSVGKSCSSDLIDAAVLKLLRHISLYLKYHSSPPPYRRQMWSFSVMWRVSEGCLETLKPILNSPPPQKKSAIHSRFITAFKIASYTFLPNFKSVESITKGILWIQIEKFCIMSCGKASWSLFGCPPQPLINV